MSDLYHSDQDGDVEDLHPSRREREITLGTTMILAIFFALAVFGAGLFGVGYSVGHRSGVAAGAGQPLNVATSSTSAGSLAPNASLAPDGSSDDPAPTPAKASKPTADSAQPVTPPRPAGNTVIIPTTASGAPLTPAPRPVSKASASDFTKPTAASAPATPATASQIPANQAPATRTPPAAGGIGFMVQVAAVSHQQDADMMMSTLRQRGYSVAVHSEPQDKLLHIQVGPLPTRKDADAMRERLKGDGFNALVKEQPH